MYLEKLRRFLPMAALCLLAVPESTEASFLGAEIQYEFLAPDLVTLDESASFTVGPGIEFHTGQSAGRAIVDLEAGSITIGPFEAAFNDEIAILFVEAAFRFSDASGALPSFFDAAIGSATTVNGVDDGRLLISEDAIFIDFSGVRVRQGEIVVIEAVFVPEPSATLLVLSGLTLLCALCRRPTRRCS